MDRPTAFVSFTYTGPFSTLLVLHGHSPHPCLCSLLDPQRVFLPLILLFLQQLLSWATSPRRPARPQLWPLPCAGNAHTFILSLLLTGKSVQLTSDSPRLHLVLNLSRPPRPQTTAIYPPFPSHQPLRRLSTEHQALSYLSPSLLLPPPEWSQPSQSLFHFGACLPQPRWSTGLTMPSQGLPHSRIQA